MCHNAVIAEVISLPEGSPNKYRLAQLVNTPAGCRVHLLEIFFATGSEAQIYLCQFNTDTGKTNSTKTASKSTAADLDYSVGTIVTFKSGGPKMTILGIINSDTVYCGWFTAEGKHEKNSFPKTVLQIPLTSQRC
jgi:uncharacterized protein YodC (DUF2158 family)